MNRLKINADNSKLSVANEDELISSVAETKHLGSQVDQYFDWEQNALLLTKSFLKV